MWKWLFYFCYEGPSESCLCSFWFWYWYIFFYLFFFILVSIQYLVYKLLEYIISQISDECLTKWDFLHVAVPTDKPITHRLFIVTKQNTTLTMIRTAYSVWCNAMTATQRSAKCPTMAELLNTWNWLRRAVCDSVSNMWLLLSHLYVPLL